MTKLTIGQEYNTEHGTLTYCGETRAPFPCDWCGRMRQRTHEFCANWEAYQQGQVGEWYHYGSECVHVATKEVS